MHEYLEFLKKEYGQFFVRCNVLVIHDLDGDNDVTTPRIFKRSINNVVESWGNHELLLQQCFYERFDVVVCDQHDVSDTLYTQLMRVIKPAGMFVYGHAQPWSVPNTWLSYFSQSEVHTDTLHVYVVGFMRCHEQHIDRTIHRPREPFRINTLVSVYCCSWVSWVLLSLIMRTWAGTGPTAGPTWGRPCS